MAAAVKTENLTKTYKNIMKREPVNAVSNLNLEVNEGEIFGFLGPNGAGKTTTIKMLLGLVYPTSGNAWILDKPAGDIEVKQQISYLPETPYFYDYMSGSEVLQFYGRLFGMNETTIEKKSMELLKTVGLYQDRYKRLSDYSKGMLQRIGIAQALINDPKLLIFDEPTTGLDPIAHSEIRDLILRLRDEGKSIFLCSHQLSDVEMVCDRVAILNRGVMLKTGHLDDLLLAGHFEIQAEKLSADVLGKINGFATCVDSACDIVVIDVEDGDKVDQTVDLIRGCHGRILSINPKRRALEDLFVEIIREGNK
jgi:ABC-2 type transport system ATP-binding protein